MAGEIQVNRWLLPARDLLVARGDFGPLFEAYVEHSRRWVGDPDGLVATMMRQGLAAAGLYLTFRALDENTAWTINFAEPPLNIFITSDAKTGKVVGRYFDQHVKTVDYNRIFVQSVRNVGRPQQSSVRVKGFDVLSIFEQYYALSEQSAARFFELGEHRFMMLSALPDADDAWLESLTTTEAASLLQAEECREIEGRKVSFGCSCDQQIVFKTVSSIFADKEAELFGEDDEVEVSCPRCGIAYTMSRDDFIPPENG